MKVQIINKEGKVIWESNEVEGLNFNNVHRVTPSETDFEERVVKALKDHINKTGTSGIIRDIDNTLNTSV